MTNQVRTTASDGHALNGTDRCAFSGSLTRLTGMQVTRMPWRCGAMASGSSRAPAFAAGCLPGGSGCTRQRMVVTVKEQPNLGADDTATETGMAARQQSRSLPIGIIIRAVARCTPECCTRGRFGQPYWLRSATRRFGLRQLLLLKAAGRTQPLRVRLSIPQLRRSNVDIVLSGAGTAGVSRGGIAVSAVPYRPNGTLQFCSALG